MTSFLCNSFNSSISLWNSAKHCNNLTVSILVKPGKKSKMETLWFQEQCLREAICSVRWRTFHFIRHYSELFYFFLTILLLYVYLWLPSSNVWSAGAKYETFFQFAIVDLNASGSKDWPNLVTFMIRGHLSDLSDCSMQPFNTSLTLHLKFAYY